MFNKKFELILRVPENWEVAGHMADNWAKHLSDAAELIKSKIDEKLPDDGTFIRDLVNPSTNAYSPMLNPSFVSRSERSVSNIRDVRQGNMSASFLRWKENMAKAFATVDGVVAKSFKDKIAAAKDRWAIRMGQGLLRFTGDRIRGRSVAPITAHYLVGDARATVWGGQGDTLDGQPYSVARDGERTSFKAAILNRIVQGGMMITKAGSDATAEITRQNAINTTLINGLRDTAKADVFVTTTGAEECFFLWEVDADSRLVLHTQVGITVP